MRKAHHTYVKHMRLRWLVVPLLASPLFAQQQEQFASRANLVPVPALVLDSDKDPIFGLSAGDFIVEDDEIEQAIHLDEAAESEPLSLVVAVQCGRRAQREFGRMSGLASMLDPILSNPENEAALVFFDRKLNLVSDFTNHAEALEDDLRNFQSGDGGAAILDAVAYSTRLLARRADNRKRVLLLISETRDHGSHFTKFDDVIRLIGENNVAIYTLPFSPYASAQLDALRGANSDEWGPNVDLRQKLVDAAEAMRKNTPKALAAMTGGEYSLFATRDGFESDLLRFTNHLHARYQLSFEPRNPHPGLHRIQVRLRDTTKGRTVLFRRSYWVEAPDTAPGN